MLWFLDRAVMAGGMSQFYPAVFCEFSIGFFLRVWEERLF